MTTSTTSPSVAARTAGCLWRLIKLFIAIVVGILLGVLLYYGGLYAYWGILAPINSNHNAINALDGDLRRTREVWEAELRVRDERIRLLSEQLQQRSQTTDALEERLVAQLRDQGEALRRQAASEQEALRTQIASFEDQRQALIEAVGNQDQRVAVLEESLQAQQEALQAQKEQIAQIVTAQGTLETAIAETAEKLGGDIAALQEDFGAEMSGLETDLGTLQGQIGGPEAELAQLRERTLLLKAAAQVLRVRIRLVQNNPGGAKGDLTQLDGTLAVIGDLPGVEADAIADLRDQVAQLQTALDENPFVVAEQLDVLWLAITDLITF